MALDPLSKAELAREDDPAVRKKLEILRGFAQREPRGKPRLLTIRFLVSPVELVGNGDGRVRALRLVRNRLVAGRDGALKAEPTGETEEIPVGLVFRSVGYQGVALPGLPFDPKSGTVPNDKGRVLALPGVYVSGWIKRGPTGVIGTNKPDAAETVETMLADAGRGAVLSPPDPAPEAVEALLRARQPELVTWPEWLRLNEVETRRGQASSRPRAKLCTVAEMLAAIRSRAAR